MESLSPNTYAEQQKGISNFHSRISKLRWIGDDDAVETLLKTERGKHDFAFAWPVEFATD
jgi:hypothetical protein